jgi:hypothetical protein
MLRHAGGCPLANAGHDTRALQDWLGHRSIQRTVCCHRRGLKIFGRTDGLALHSTSETLAPKYQAEAKARAEQIAPAFVGYSATVIRCAASLLNCASWKHRAAFRPTTGAP